MRCLAGFLVVLVTAASGIERGDNHDSWREIWEETSSSTENIAVAAHLKDFPPLCAPAVVAQTCTLLNDQTPNFFGTASDSNPTAVHAAEIGASLYASPSSVRRFLTQLGLINTETNRTALANDAYAVSCERLCQKVQASFQPQQLPSVSDVACSWTGTATAVCDQDVSPEALSKSSRQLDSKLRPEGGAKVPSESSSNDLASVDALPDQADKYLQQLIAQLFRFYPMMDNPDAAVLVESGCVDLQKDCTAVAANNWCDKKFSPTYWQWNRKQCAKSCRICNSGAAAGTSDGTKAFCTVGTIDSMGSCICADVDSCQGSGCTVEPADAWSVGISYYQRSDANAECIVRSATSQAPTAATPPTTAAPTAVSQTGMKHTYSQINAHI